MFSFFKRNRDTSQVPEWASFFSNKEYTSFLKAIDNYFKSKNISYEHDDGIIRTGENDFGFTNLGLSNVAQVCKQNKPGYYSAIIYDHFEAITRGQLFDKEFQKIVHDFDKIKHYIGVRLYPVDYADYIGKTNTIGKNFGGDVYAMLIFDLPDSIINIQPDQAKKWEKTYDELFELGVRNIKENYPLQISRQDLRKFKVWYVQGEHFFTANVIFDLETHPEFIGRYGSLVAIPHRHSAFIYPVENSEVLVAVNDLLQMVYRIHIEGPGSISNNLFWYKDGKFENLPYKVVDNTLEFSPPAPFVEMLNEMTQE